MVEDKVYPGLSDELTRMVTVEDIFEGWTPGGSTSGLEQFLM